MGLDNVAYKIKKRLNESFGYLEQFYGMEKEEIIDKIKSSTYFSRTAKGKLGSVADAILSKLNSKGYFSQLGDLSPTTYNMGTRKRLVNYGLLCYEDLSFYLFRLSVGQRRYFFSNIMKLPGENQQRKLMERLFSYIRKEVIQTRTHPISVDWFQCGVFNEETRILLLDWGVLTVLDLKNAGDNLGKIWSSLASCFGYDKSFFLTVMSFIKKIFDFL